MSAILSDVDILREREMMNIVIEPFKRINLANCSYDVTLGKYYYRSSVPTEFVYNPWSEEHIQEYWGQPKEAKILRKDKYGLKEGQSYIKLRPGERILGHTEEFIGGRNFITSEMKTRSSLARSCIMCCACAGWGDIGYVNRWTMEITSVASCPIVLPIGERVAQIIFLRSSVPYKTYLGKYQTCSDVEFIMENWKPEDMLPKLHLENRE
jgi:Deoxycytidine deaminase